MENLREKAARLLKIVEARAGELEQGPPAARIAAICLKHGIPPYSLRRAQLDGVTLRIGSRTFTLSEGEAALLKPWAGSRYGLRTVAYHTNRALKGLGLKVYDVYLLKMIVEGKPPRKVPVRLLHALTKV